MADKRPALGRGLSALIPDAAAPSLNDRSLDVDTDLLRPNPFQPRTAIDETKIEELARSIRANGVIQPIIVRRAAEGYEIVAGERSKAFAGASRANGAGPGGEESGRAGRGSSPREEATSIDGKHVFVCLQTNAGSFRPAVREKAPPVSGALPR